MLRILPVMLPICPCPRQSLCTAGLYAPPWGRTMYIHYLHSPWEIGLLSPFDLWAWSFIYVRIDVWIFILYFKMVKMVNGSIILYFAVHIVPGLAFGSSFSWLLCPFVISPSSSSFICLYFLLYYKMLQDPSCVFPERVLKLIISPGRMSGQV